MSNVAYHEFLARKAITDPPTGLEVIPDLPERLFPFQHDIASWALRRGRAALFAGTGLGKSFMELAWADAVHRETGKDILHLAPLAVTAQMVREADKFGIAARQVRDQAGCLAGTNITNYQKLDHFGVFLAADPDREQHKWVFRCDCGRYAQFGSKAVYKQNGLGRAQCGECDYLSGIKNGTVSSPLERPALREVKALDRDARKALADKRDAVFHPMIDELIASLPDGYTRKDALNAMTTFVSAESAKLKLAAGGEQTQP